MEARSGRTASGGAVQRWTNARPWEMLPSRSDMHPDEPIEHELLRNAVAAEVTVTSTEVSPTSTGDRYVRIEGRLGDDEESHAEWAAIGFIYALGVLSFAAARPRGVSGIGFEEHDQGTAA